MPVINTFRLTVLLVVAAFYLYPGRRLDQGYKRAPIEKRAAIPQWPGLTFPLPFSSDWNGLVDVSTLPKLAVRPTVDSCPGSDAGCTWSCTNCLAPDDVVCPDKNALALTFDDGPTSVTPTLLDTLAKDNIKATFFVIGSQLLDDNFKATLKRTYNEGHQIAIHTWSHRALTTLSNQEVISELLWTRDIIKSVIGVSPIYFRPPYGDVDDRVRAIARQLGLKCTIWTHDSKDYEIPTTPSINVADEFKKWLSDASRTTGIIPLEHDLNSATVGAVPGALAVIKASTFNLQTVAQCHGGQPYAEAVDPVVPIISTNTPSVSHATTSTSTPTTANTISNDAKATTSKSTTPVSSTTAQNGATANDVFSMTYFVAVAVVCLHVAF